MMLLKLAWRDLRRRPVQHMLTILMAGAAIALSVAVMLAAASTEKGMTEAAMPFDMIVGAKGSPTQLIFNTIFLQDSSTGNIPGSIRQQLEEDERVKRVIPFAMGDTCQGYRVIGSDSSLFTLRPSEQEPEIFQLSEGRFFESGYEAVVGATAAKELGISVGDRLNTSHGLTHDGTEEAHEEGFVVTGILKSMNRPYDTGIFVPIEAVWEEHGNTENDVTALMVTPKNYAGLYQLYSEINAGTEAQAVFPGVVMGEIFENLGQTEDLLNLVSWISMGIGLIGMAVSLSWSALARMKENALMRAMGAGRSQILTVVLVEGLMLSVFSIAAGLLAGHAAAWMIAGYMKTTQAFYSPVIFRPEEWIVSAAAAGAGLLISLIPALKAYRTDVIKNLAAE